MMNFVDTNYYGTIFVHSCAHRQCVVDSHLTYQGKLYVYCFTWTFLTNADCCRTVVNVHNHSWYFFEDED